MALLSSVLDTNMGGNPPSTGRSSGVVRFAARSLGGRVIEASMTPENLSPIFPSHVFGCGPQR